MGYIQYALHLLNFITININKWDMNGYELSIMLQLQKFQYPAVPWGGKVLQSQVMSARKITLHGGKSSYIG